MIRFTPWLLLHIYSVYVLNIFLGALDWSIWSENFLQFRYMVLAFFPLNYLAWIANWYNRYKERYLNMVSVYNFTCVDQQLHKLTVGHQELGDQVDVPVSKKWWNDLWNEVLWHCFLPSPSIALIRRRNPKLGEKFLKRCQRGRFTSIIFVPGVESEESRTEMELGGFW